MGSDAEVVADEGVFRIGGLGLPCVIGEGIPVVGRPSQNAGVVAILGIVAAAAGDDGHGAVYRIAGAPPAELVVAVVSGVGGYADGGRELLAGLWRGGADDVDVV